MSNVSAAGCVCRPPWPALVVHTVDGDIPVVPSVTPGALAHLYWAYCVGCAAVYPGPFRVPPEPRPDEATCEAA